MRKGSWLCALEMKERGVRVSERVIGNVERC